MASTMRQWIGWAMLGVFVLSVATWYVTRPRLPEEIRIATALPGGLYHQIGGELANEFSARTGCRVTRVATAGSVENLEKLLSGDVDLAILQAGAVSLKNVSVLAPLYLDAVHVIVRRDRGLATLSDFSGRKVALGPEGSGMRVHALRILEHYQIPLSSLEENDRYFLDLLEDDSLDAAIVITGVLNPDLSRLLESGLFDLLPILDARAISIRHPYYHPFEIPRGMYGEGPAVPDQPLLTASTTAVLAAPAEVSDLLVREALSSVYETAFRSSFSTMIHPEDVLKAGLVLHPEARSYFNPYEGLDVLKDFLEGFAAGKELLLAVGAGLYLLWDYRRRKKESETAAQVREQKEMLNKFLMETVRVERAQMDTEEVSALEDFLDEVTLIKLTAIEELSHDALRGDRTFQIFLTQCANLIRKIQSKIDTYSRRQEAGLDRE